MVTDVAAQGGADRFVELATVGDAAEARICAALLAAEGIDSRLHGEAFGPYPMTVGAFAATQVWVPESRLADARRVMLEAEVAAVVNQPVESSAADAGLRPAVVWLVALGVLAVIGVRILVFVL